MKLVLAMRRLWPTWWREHRLVTAQVIAGGLYVMLLVMVAVHSYRTPVPYRFYGDATIFFACVMAVMVMMLWRRRPVGRLAWALAGALVAIALASFPNTSRDYLRYLFDGEMIRLLQASPYAHLPGEFPPDQYSRLFDGIFWVHIPSPYGPLWQTLMVVINWVTDNRLMGGIWLLKLVDLAGLLVVARYLWLISGRVWPAWMVLINPVVLLNTVATPHPDIMIAAMLLAAYYHRNLALRGSLVAVAGLIKVHALIFAPFLTRKAWQWWLIIVTAAVATGGLLLVLKRIVGFDWVPMFSAMQGGGVNAMESLLARQLLPGAAEQTIFAASYGLFAVAYGAVAVAFWRRKLAPLDALTLTSFLVPLFLTGLLLPWHFIIPLVFLLLYERAEPYWLVLFLSLTVLRSAVMVHELAGLAAGFGISGWLLYWVFRQLKRPPWFAGWLVERLR